MRSEPVPDGDPGPILGGRREGRLVARALAGQDVGRDGAGDELVADLEAGLLAHGGVVEPGRHSRSSGRCPWPTPARSR